MRWNLWFWCLFVVKEKVGILELICYFFFYVNVWFVRLYLVFLCMLVSVMIG